MGLYSRNKGKRWEREVARLMREIFGNSVHRGWQARSPEDACDVDGTPFWIECKVGRKTNIKAALSQSLNTAKKGRCPVAICKDDMQEPTATMFLYDWLDLVKEWNERSK